MRYLILVLVTLSAALPVSAEVTAEVPFVRQKKNGCGAASVAMVMQYWTANHPQLELIAPDPAEIYDELYRPDLRSITLSSMRQYLADHGYAAFNFRGEAPDLELQIDKGRPLIVALRGRSEANLHFAVLSGIDDGRAQLNDPTRQRVKWVKRAKFEKSWRRAGRWLLLAAPTKRK